MHSKSKSSYTTIYLFSKCYEYMYIIIYDFNYGGNEQLRYLFIILADSIGNLNNFFYKYV